LGLAGRLPLSRIPRVLLRILVELALTALRAEIIGFTLILGLSRRLPLINIHPTNGVFMIRHESTPFLSDCVSRTVHALWRPEGFTIQPEV
jgi:hypothetical protein